MYCTGLRSVCLATSQRAIMAKRSISPWACSRIVAAAPGRSARARQQSTSASACAADLHAHGRYSQAVRTWPAGAGRSIGWSRAQSTISGCKIFGCQGSVAASLFSIHSGRLQMRARREGTKIARALGVCACGARRPWHTQPALLVVALVDCKPNAHWRRRDAGKCALGATTLR